MNRNNRATLTLVIKQNINSKKELLQKSEEVKFFTNQVRGALDQAVACLFVRSIDCRHAQESWKLPYFRPFQPDIQILSALAALHWPSTAFCWPSNIISTSTEFYWPSTTKCQPVPAYTYTLDLERKNLTICFLDTAIIVEHISTVLK